MERKQIGRQNETMSTRAVLATTNDSIGWTGIEVTTAGSPEDLGNYLLDTISRSGGDLGQVVAELIEVAAPSGWDVVGVSRRSSGGQITSDCRESYHQMLWLYVIDVARRVLSVVDLCTNASESMTISHLGAVSPTPAWRRERGGQIRLVTDFEATVPPVGDLEAIAAANRVAASSVTRFLCTAVESFLEDLGVPTSVPIEFLGKPESRRTTKLIINERIVLIPDAPNMIVGSLVVGSRPVCLLGKNYWRAAAAAEIAEYPGMGVAKDLIRLGTKVVGDECDEVSDYEDGSEFAPEYRARIVESNPGRREISMEQAAQEIAPENIRVGAEVLTSMSSVDHIDGEFTVWALKLAAILELLGKGE